MRDVSLRRLASYASLGVAVVLVAVKLAAWIVTGSVALLTSAVDALVDMAASLATLLGVRYAERPPDRDHRFGHGKGEAVAGFTQSAFLAGAAIVLAFQSTERLIFPAPVKQLGLGLGVIIASLLAAAALVAMQTWVVRQTASTAIAADRVHYLTDVAVTVAVLAALGVTWFTGWERADPAFALTISRYMLWNSRGIAVDALKQLLDRELPPIWSPQASTTSGSTTAWPRCDIEFSVISRLVQSQPGTACSWLVPRLRGQPRIAQSSRLILGQRFRSGSPASSRSPAIYC
jgi:ferrous-iron efflux pump FieF